MLFAVHVFIFTGAHDLSYALSMFLFLRVLMTSVIPKIYFALTGRMYFDAVYTQGGALGYWIYALTGRSCAIFMARCFCLQIYEKYLTQL